MGYEALNAGVGDGGPDGGSPAGLLSARRAVAVLLAFSPAHHTLSARDVAEETGLPLPSAYRYLALLRDLGLLLDGGPGRYRLSGRVFGLAEAARAAEPLLEVADPVMRRLAAETGEAVALFQLVSGRAVCVHRIESTRLLRVSFPPGSAHRLDRGASSRVLLAALPDDARHALLAELTAGDPVRSAELARAIDLARARGWATGDQEIDEGIWVAAAAVEGGSGAAACLAVPSPSVRARPAEQDDLLALVCAAAQSISRSLQAVAPR